MITKAELQEVQDNLMAKPMNHSILILIPTIEEVTDTGIIKGDALMKEEEEKQDAFLTVVAVADEMELDIQPGDRVYIQGTVNSFPEDQIPAELDVAPSGYAIGHTMEMYVKMRIR